MEPRTFHPICQTKKIGFPIPALTVSNVMLEQWDVEKVILSYLIMNM